MIWSISWKNVWRSKLRSIIVVVAVTVGLFGGVFAIALMNGVVEQKFKSTIENEISHIQIHNPDFKIKKEPQFFITNADSIVNQISKITEVKSVCKRTQLISMVSTASTTIGVIVLGINPEQEKKVTKIYSTILDSAGNYFESDKKNQILISSKLAEKLQLTNYEITDITILNLKEKDVPQKIIDLLLPLKEQNFRKESHFKDTLKLVLGISEEEKYEYAILNFSRKYKLRSNIILKIQDIYGQIIDKSFKVSGIYSTENGMYDQMHVFVNNQDLIEFTGYNSTDCHEIAIMLNNIKDAESVVEKLKLKFPNLKSESWTEIQPMMAMMTSWVEFYYFIFIAIILFALGFGIVNTMLMVVLERVKELGMLMAIGMNKRKIFVMIMLESIFLSITGGIVGLIITALTVWATKDSGIDLSANFGDGFSAIGVKSIIYPALTLKYYFGVGFLVILTGIVSAIYPARKALKLNPADAVRSDY